ncbi:Por secretion system C-terminal sorting domain-containing protein [Dyadobacter sp. SG02]|nr:Por secretion system C-terminal sorting domain-containing protein [Dyadobacter sp. SG02]
MRGMEPSGPPPKFISRMRMIVRSITRKPQRINARSARWAAVASLLTITTIAFSVTRPALLRPVINSLEAAISKPLKKLMPGKAKPSGDPTAPDPHRTMAPQGAFPLQRGMALVSRLSNPNAGAPGQGSDRNGFVLGVYDARNPAGNGAPAALANWNDVSNTIFRHPDWTNAKMGEVFGIEIDNSVPATPQVFVGSTGTFVGYINGSAEYAGRTIPAVGSEGGDVFRIDGNTGLVSTITNAIPSTGYHTSGGRGATAMTVPLNTTAGRVKSVAINAGGSGYALFDPLVFTGGGGTGAAGYVTVTAGVVTGIVLTNQGTGYGPGPVTVSVTSVGGGTGFTGTVTMGYPLQTGIIVPTSGGANYPFLGATIMGDGIGGGVATAFAGGSLTQYNINAAGLDYTYAPTVTINNRYTGVGNVGYNYAKKVVYTSSLDNGNIYAIDATTGTFLGTPFDHQPGIADPSLAVTDLRRLAVGMAWNPRDNRLYFSRPDAVGYTTAGTSYNFTHNEIVSIGLNADGSINTADVIKQEVRLPVTALQLDQRSLITDIEFTSDGTIALLGEMSTGNSAFRFTTSESRFTKGSHNAIAREYRFDGTAWSMNEEYHVGNTYSGYNNTGGADFGYGNSENPEAYYDAAVLTGDYIEGSGVVYGIQVSPLSQGNYPTNSPFSHYVIDDNTPFLGLFVEKTGIGDVDVFSGVDYPSQDIVLALGVITQPTDCGTSNGIITITGEGLLPNTPYPVTYVKDGGAPVSVSIVSNASGIIEITGLPAGAYTGIQINDPPTYTSNILATTLTCVTPTPFTCQDITSYLLRDDDSQLYTVDLRTGTQTLLFDAATLGNRDLTALGYNPVDNFLYASVSGTNDIVRIHASGAVQVIDIPTLPADSYEAGDFAPDGTFYLYSASATTMYKVNVSTLAVTTISVSAANAQDISITPNGQNILAISNGNGTLVNWPIAGGTATTTDVGQNGTALSAATFIDATGDLFLVSAGSGSVYEVPGPTYPVPGSLTRLTPNLATPLTNIDGARCPSSLATTNSPLSCAPNQAYLVVGDEGYNGANCGGMNAHTVLSTYDIITGSTTTSAQLLQDFNGPRTTINNLGYNPTDNYLWGFRFGTNQLVRIGAGNVTDLFAIEGLPDQCPTGTQQDPENNFFHAGDVSPDGIMYLLNGQNGTQLYRVDINPASPNYLKLVTPTLSLSLSPGAGTLSDVPDLAINPVDNQLYSVSANQNLIRIDVNTGTVTNLGPLSGLAPLAGANSYVAQYFDNTGNMYIQSSNSDDLYKIANVAGGGLAAILYDGTSVAIGGAGDAARCALAPIGGISISGNVFNDLNGNVTLDGSPEAGTDASSASLTVYLVDGTGNVVDAADIAADGSYNFPAAQENTAYTIVLSNTGGVTPGSPAPAPSLPDTWINTGERFGVNNGAGTGTETATPGVIAVTTVTSDISGVDFGIEQGPETAVNLQPSQSNPGGTTSVTVPVQAFVTSNVGANPNTGDPTPGAVTGIVITSFPTNATSITIDGNAYTNVTDIIDDYPQGIPTDATGQPTVTIGIDPVDGAVSVVIPIAAIDAAGVQDATPGSITLPFTVAATVSLSGTVFNDVNGLNPTPANTVDGTPVQSPSGTPLHANLFTEAGAFIATTPVDASGNYIFNNVTASTTYLVTISTTPAASGSTPAGSIGLPANWVNTGENVGLTAGSDGTVNGILQAVVTTTDLSDVNFGIQQVPESDDKSAPLASQPSTDALIPLDGGLAPALTGSDPEDNTTGGPLHTRTILITSLPTNGELWYGGTQITVGDDGENPVSPTNPFTITNLVLADLEIKLTGSGYTSTSFTYAYVDNAGFPDPTPATYTLTWENPLPVTLVSFTAAREGNVTQLAWATSEESNSEYFEVQRSSDGNAWTSLARINSVGESTQLHNYTYTDAQPQPGQNLYRLKMVDRATGGKDGNFAFSVIRSVGFESAFNATLSPNPVSDMLKITSANWSSVKTVRIFDAAGRLVYDSGSKPQQTISIRGLVSGTHVVVIEQTDGKLHSQRIIVMR